MTALVVITSVLVAVAITLMVGMFRRDEPILGLIGLSVGLLAAIPAVVYAGLGSV